jgi:formate hydrogenlyase subunit 6/NADH:ubiquinone oxidoreductase subunit I
MKFLKLLMRNLAKGPSTDPFPFGETFTPKTLRGRLRFDVSICTVCRACEQVCAAGAIRIDRTPEGMRFMLWQNTCVFCGLCHYYCPTGALTHTDDWHMSQGEGEKFDLVEEGVIPSVACAGCGAKMVATYPNPKTLGFEATKEDVEKLRLLCPNCRRKAIAAMGGKS